VTETLERLRAALPVLISVLVSAELATPTDWLPNARLPTERLTAGCCATPVPDSGTIREGVVQSIMIWPVMLRVVVGAKLTVKLVLWLGPRTSGKDNPLILKPFPHTPAVTSTTFPVPVLMRVTVWLLLVPTVTLPKLTLCGLELSVAVASRAIQTTAINKNKISAGRTALGVFWIFSICELELRYELRLIIPGTGIGSPPLGRMFSGAGGAGFSNLSSPPLVQAKNKLGASRERLRR